MAFRVKRFGRRIRKRTRWLAIQPDSLGTLVNNTFLSKEIIVRDSAGALPLMDFAGGTLLRVVAELEVQPDIVTTTGTSVGSWIVHTGLFTAPDATPDSTIWTPNSPAGSFMQRLSSSGFYRKESTTDGGGSVIMYNKFGRTISYDTEVKRRIVENDKLWFTAWPFFVSAVQGVSVGYTGRVLIQLP